MKKQRKKKLIAVVIVALVSLLIFGYIKFFNGTFIYISTGFGKDGLLKTGNKKASVMEADILLADAKSEYEDKRMFLQYHQDYVLHRNQYPFQSLF